LGILFYLVAQSIDATIDAVRRHKLNPLGIVRCLISPAGRTFIDKAAVRKKARRINQCGW
jgi:hypothetical protein